MIFEFFRKIYSIKIFLSIFNRGDQILKKRDDAKMALNNLTYYPDSYVQLENNDKLTYEQLANNAFQVFIKQKNK